MIEIHSHMGKSHYALEVQTRSGNKIIADEPVDNGGQNSGFAPKELLIAALAACTSATIRMYADHKEWDLETIDVTIRLQQDDPEVPTQIHRDIKLSGDLTAEQRERILSVANKCPVHKILSSPVHTISRLVE